MNGDLAVIKDNTTMTKILEHTQESTWIGLKKDQLADSKYQTHFRYHKTFKIKNQLARILYIYQTCYLSTRLNSLEVD